MPVDVWGIIGATLPGVLVALVGYFLSLWHEAQVERQFRLRARELVSLEIKTNLNALAEHWRTINGLDTEQQTEIEAHIRTMAEHGLLSYDAPVWSTSRWEGFPAQALASLTQKQALEIDTQYRSLGRINDLYARFITMTDEEKQEYGNQRYWALHFAGYRVELYERLRSLVQQVLDAGNPLEK